jgi:hypothetical protein
LIIVEGPDGSGKTSLVKSMKAMTGLQQAMKAVTPEMKAQVHIEEYIENSLGITRRELIYDRFALISGPIYGPFFGMRPPNDLFKHPAKFYTWLQRLRIVEPVMVYCLPPWDTVAENLHKTIQPRHIDMHVWEGIYWSYWAKAHQDMADPCFPTYIYDYTADKSVHAVVNWVRSQIGAHA